MGWHPADIRAAVQKRGSTLKAVAQQAGLNAAACRLALRDRHIGGEQAIAAFLAIPLWDLWPDRWSPAGQRLDHRTKPLRAIRRRNNSGAGPDASCQKSRAA